MKKIEEVDTPDGKYFFDRFQFYRHNPDAFRCSHYMNKCTVTAKVKQFEGKTIYQYLNGDKTTHNHPDDIVKMKKSQIYEDLRSKKLRRSESVSLVAKSILKKHGEEPDKEPVLKTKTCINVLLREKEKYKKKKFLNVETEKYIIGETKNAIVYADSESVEFFEKSDTIFCDGKYEKKFVRI